MFAEDCKAPANPQAGDERIIPLAAIRIRVEMRPGISAEKSLEHCNYYRNEIKEVLQTKGYVVRWEGDTHIDYDDLLYPSGGVALGTTLLWRSKDILPEELKRYMGRR